MNVDRRTAVAALAAAGLLWGTTVPVTKLALQWLPPGWLTVARFGLAAAVLLGAVGPRARAAASPAVLAWGAVGYGGTILVQNAGIARTSVSHAALLVGATPVLVAAVAAVRHRSVAHPVAWTGFAVSFAGVGQVAAGGGAGATFTGDALVLVSLGFSASFTVAQARLLPGRDPAAVTAVQLLAAALATLPVAAATEGVPPAPAGAPALLATGALALLGTLAPFTLFAYGQARVSPEIAGAFVNLEPLVGAAAGAVVFGDPVGPAQAGGGAAILTGIALSSLPLLLARDPGPPGRRGRGLRRRGRSGSPPSPPEHDAPIALRLVLGQVEQPDRSAAAIEPGLQDRPEMALVDIRARERLAADQIRAGTAQGGGDEHASGPHQPADVAHAGLPGRAIAGGRVRAVGADHRPVPSRVRCAQGIGEPRVGPEQPAGLGVRDVLALT
jgi:O-acetylserine/cysteine efflux transporter